MKYFLIMTKNIPQKTKYGRFKCSTEDFENAVRAMKSGNLSTKKASLNFNISKSTFSMKLREKTIESTYRS